MQDLIQAKSVQSSSSSPFDIDVVVTYVDNTDPVWKSAISSYNTEINDTRYRKWDNLKYWFRGIAKNMPYVRKVWLVVSNIEQVPDWVDRSQVNVILHSDIIPAKYLPTFNSTTIEMFLCKIPDLAEHFIYFNDDMFAMKPMAASAFFDTETGHPIYQLIERYEAKNTFRLQCRNSYRFAKELAEDKTEQDRRMYRYIKHSADPMLKSDCLEVWKKGEEKLLWSLTRFREPFNFTQYLFPLYSIFKGHCKLQELDFMYYNITHVEMYGDVEFREDGQHALICLNDRTPKEDKEDQEAVEDNKMSSEEYEQNHLERYEKLKAEVTKLFEMKFSEKCKFEIVNAEQIAYN